MAAIRPGTTLAPAEQDGTTADSSRALAKGLRLLETLAAAPAPLPLAELARAIDLGKASTLRLLQTLLSSGYVVQTARGEYAPQATWRMPALDEWSRSLLSVAVPEMLRLNEESAETVSLAVLRDDHIRVIETIESPQHVRMANTRHRILPPYASSLGKAIAAFQTSEGLSSLISVYGLHTTTEKTLTDLNAIRREMETVRRLGYAREYEETVRGGCCFGAPIHDGQGRVRAAVSVSLPTVRLTSCLEERLPAMVMDCARRIGDEVRQHRE
jgi:IclR family acetate operon transcriptional repressor